MQIAERTITIAVTILLVCTFSRTSSADTIPVPVERPTQEVQAAKPESPIPATEVQPANGETEASTQDACLAKLQKLGHAIAVVQPTPKDKACVIASPVSLISLTSKTGNITLPADMLNDCAFALDFASWVADVANPLAKQHLGHNISKVQSGKGFTCRRRNNLPTGNLSEHALGNAVDIIGFTLSDHSQFQVKDPAEMKPTEARFFNALRKTACGYFTTVLGPGSNAAHATHLHLDLGIHGKTGNYRICE